MKTPLIYSICIKTQDEYYKRHLTHFFTEKEMNVTDDADIANIIIFHSAKFSDQAPDVIRKFRMKNDVPIIALSNGYTEKAILDLYDSGIDFCGTLPMKEEEIYLRALVFIRRTPFKRNIKAYKFGNVILSGMRLIRSDGIIISIPLREYQLISFLFEHADEIVYMKTIIKELYDIDNKYDAGYHFARRTLDIYIGRIRKHLAGTSIEIATIRGQGWILQEKTLQYATPL